MSSPRVLRAALYARVSTDDQDVGLQIDELRQVAAQRGLVLVAEYSDKGVSGAKTSRPGLDAMLRDAQAGHFDLLLVWKLDRLGRSLQHVLSVLDTLAASGVGFVSVRDPGIDTSSPSGRLLLQILAAFAQFERDLIQERVIAGVRRAQASGIHCGRPRREAAEQALQAARALLDQGWAWRAVSKAVAIPRDTLKRRLIEAGMLGDAVAQIPPLEQPA